MSIFLNIVLATNSINKNQCQLCPDRKRREAINLTEIYFGNTYVNISPQIELFTLVVGIDRKGSK